MDARDSRDARTSQDCHDCHDACTIRDIRGSHDACNARRAPPPSDSLQYRGRTQCRGHKKSLPETDRPLVVDRGFEPLCHA